MPVEPASGERRDNTLPQALGKYIPVARLGSGGMADVFLAVAQGPVGFHKLVVVKRLRNSDDEAHVEMFLDEARLAARLNHANIVHTYEVGESKGTLFIAMEYLEGQSLQALVARLQLRSEWLSDSLVAYIAVQALKGLHFAHELRDFDGAPLGVVHRDVSPHNLYLTYGGEVKLLDFGVAKAEMNAGHTEAGTVKGKIRYMAPEQLGDREVDRRADIFAFGVVLWELLAHRPLFQGDAPSVMARVVGEDVGPVRAVRPDVAPELDAIALKALKRKPAERYASADEMRAALEVYLRSRDEPFDRDLARVINGAFAEVRDDVRDRVKTFLRDLRTDDNSARDASFGRTSELPFLPRGTDTGGPQTASLAGEAAAVRSQAPRWSWLLLVVGASIAGVVALGQLGRRIREPTVARTAALSEDGSLAPPATLPLPSASASSPVPPLASTPPSTLVPPPSASAPVAKPAPGVHHVAPTPLATASARPRVNIRVLDDSDSP